MAESSEKSELYCEHHILAALVCVLFPSMIRSEIILENTRAQILLSITDVNKGISDSESGIEQFGQQS